ncbi:MAG: tetratricopeptide repeat protein [Flavobacteriales bacterium]|nr:tetratricopeptide repeat protein [Flavobacteriales bacterium]
MKLLNGLLIILLISSCVQPNGDGDADMGIDAYRSGNLEEAVKSLKLGLSKGVTKYPEEQILTILGNVYNDLDEFDSSIVYHKKALEIDPNNVDALVNLGIVYRLTSQFDLAEESYNKAKAINPNDPELHASLGALHIYKGNLAAALESLEKSIELDPQLAIAHSNYALALAMDGQFEKAEQELKTAVAMGYKNGEVMKERIEQLKNVDV